MQQHISQSVPNETSCVKDNTYIDSSKDVNDKDPKFKIGSHVRISKYRNNFAKGYNPNWSEEVFVIKKLQYHGHMLLMILMAKKLLEHFIKKNRKKKLKKLKQKKETS